MTVQDPSVATDASPTPIDWFSGGLGAFAFVVLFAPIVVMYFFYEMPDTSALNTSAETVGVAVILRATLRRLFRSGSRSVLQTAVGTVTRASARTMTRRVVRVGVKSMTMFARRGAADVESDLDRDDADLRQSPGVAVVLGFVALAVSLAGVLLLIDVEHRPGDAAALPSTEVLRGMSLPLAALLGSIPFLVYVVLLTLAAPRCGASVGFRTGWESLLLQAYFTGSGSYLPLATDSEIAGPEPARFRLALCSLGGLFALHLGCATIGNAVDSYALQYVGGMFLLYCFVFSFPIAPLDGYYIWSRSRSWWLLIWIPILISFIWALPESLHVIL